MLRKQLYNLRVGGSNPNIPRRSVTNTDLEQADQNTDDENDDDINVEEEDEEESKTGISVYL